MTHYDDEALFEYVEGTSRIAADIESHVASCAECSEEVGEHREMIETVMREGGFESVRREEVLHLIHEHGTLARARAEAERYANEAIESLSVFPLTPYRQALLSVPRFIIEREM